MAQYEGIDMAELEKELKHMSADSNSANTGEDAKFVRMPTQREGKVIMRILPKKKGGSHWYCATRLHYLSMGNGNKRAYHCTRNRIDTDKGIRWVGDCFICKYYSMLWRDSEKLSGDEQVKLQNQARDIKPVERYYFNVIVRQETDPRTNETKQNVGPKVYSAPKVIYEKILRAMKGDDMAGEAPLGDITNPKTGRDFRVVKKTVRVGNGPEYPNYDASKFEEISQVGTVKEFESWLDSLHDLNSLRVLKTQEELKQAIRVHTGMASGQDEQDDDLAEFRTNGKQASTSTASDVIREELVVTTTKPAASFASSSSSSSEEEQMADEDFMKDLEDM